MHIVHQVNFFLVAMPASSPGALPQGGSFVRCAVRSSTRELPLNKEPLVGFLVQSVSFFPSPIATAVVAGAGPVPIAAAAAAAAAAASSNELCLWVVLALLLDRVLVLCWCQCWRW